MESLTHVFVHASESQRRRISELGISVGAVDLLSVFELDGDATRLQSLYDPWCWHTLEHISRLADPRTISCPGGEHLPDEYTEGQWGYFSGSESSISEFKTKLPTGTTYEDWEM